MDILFVIDDSGSMSEEQSNLRDNFPAFIDVINNHVTSAGEQLDYRIGVTTTGRDVDYTMTLPPPFPTSVDFSERGANGALQQSCGMSRPWLSRYDDDVAGTFSCVADVGTGGPGIEMPFHALELAFTERLADGANAGFLREDALLAIVVLTDEDDCSRRDNDFEVEGDSCDAPGNAGISVPQALDFLDGLKGSRGRWATAVIAGPGPGTCSSAFGEAFEATRLRQFVGDAGANAVFSSICDGDLSSALGDALNTFDAACEQFPPVL